MIATPRVWNQVYTVTVNTQAGVTYSSSVPNYIKTTDYLKGKLIKRISVSALARQDLYLYLYNTNNEILLNGYPVQDLFDGIVGGVPTDPLPKDRLFDLMDVDLARSYWAPALSFGAVATATLFRISFYF